jgi:hypothetical protein
MVFALPNTEIVGSNPAPGMDYAHFFVRVLCCTTKLEASRWTDPPPRPSKVKVKVKVKVRCKVKIKVRYKGKIKGKVFPVLN